ncbi:MAG: hypothetical protein U0R19_27780 [Bryobacteraceae bacterium]
MDVLDLMEPVLSGGIRNTNFFNGRLLTAEDLITEQAANRGKHRQLGGVLGEGVAQGFDITVASQSTTARPVLKITPGLAINRNGEVLELKSDVLLGLTPSEQVDFGEAGLFVVCVPPSPALTNPGLYLLTASPASGFAERAPMIELGSDGLASKCGSRYTVEGLRFGMLRIVISQNPVKESVEGLLADAIGRYQNTTPLAGQSLWSNPDLSLIRNSVAHLMLGTEELEGLLKNPRDRSGATSYGLLDRLRTQGLLTSCDVPLALFYWRPAGLQFVDSWAARRPLASQASRTRADGAARFQQFQAHLSELLQSSMSTGQVSAIQARQHFRYLPPAGILPVAAPGVRGFALEAFLFQSPRRNVEYLEGSVLAKLLTDSFEHDAVDLAEREFLWVYAPWQNGMARRTNTGLPPFVVFTSAHMPYAGPARLDAARWDFSNYASCHNCGA